MRFRISLLQVDLKPAPLADQHQEAPSRGEVPLVRLQVSGQAADALGKNGDLNGRCTRISLALAVLSDEFFLFS